MGVIVILMLDLWFAGDNRFCNRTIPVHDDDVGCPWTWASKEIEILIDPVRRVLVTGHDASGGWRQNVGDFGSVSIEHQMRGIGPPLGMLCYPWRAGHI